MNNIELEARIKTLCAIENYFDMVIAIKDFEKEYKTTDFYKMTKRPLENVVKEARLHYALQLKDLGRHIQALIDNLSVENLNELLDKIGIVFGEENKEIRESLEVMKDLKD